MSKLLPHEMVLSHDMLLSSFLPEETDERINSVQTAVPLTNIWYLLDAIDRREDERTEIYRHGNLVGEFARLNVELENGMLHIYDALDLGNSPITLHSGAIRAYHETETTISIYPRDKDEIGQEKYFKSFFLKFV